jgi:hypothetical protein
MIPPDQRIVVVDFRIPFLRLVFFFVKAALAAIPAILIVGAIFMVLSAAVVAMLGGNLDAILRELG